MKQEFGKTLGGLASGYGVKLVLVTLPISGFGVNFYQPDDPYVKNNRSFKYAWLF